MKFFRKFRCDENGSMTVEFAILLPLLLTVIVAGFEFFDAFKSYGRAAKVTYALADNMSRRRTFDDQEAIELYTLMNALLPWMNEDKNLTITSITYDKDKGYEVDWSMAADKNLTLNFNLALNDSVISTTEYTDILPAIAHMDSIILVETTIPHRTLFKFFGLADLVWHNQVAIRPRFVPSIPDVTNVGSGPDPNSGGSGSGGTPSAM